MKEFCDGNSDIISSDPSTLATCDNGGTNNNQSDCNMNNMPQEGVAGGVQGNRRTVTTTTKRIKHSGALLRARSLIRRSIKCDVLASVQGSAIPGIGIPVKMPQCYVETCGNYYEKTRGTKDVIYHMLPGESILAAKWIKACGKKCQKVPYYARVCSEHFSEKCYQRDLQHELMGLPLRRKLKPGAVPDRNLPKPVVIKTKPLQREPLKHQPSTVPNIIRKKTVTITRKKTTEPVGKRPKTIITQTSLLQAPEIELVVAPQPNIPELAKPTKLNNEVKIPMRSSYRIAKKKSIETLSDSFTEKVNSKSDRNSTGSKTEKFSDKLKFMAKLQLKFERKEEFVPLPKYSLEKSLEKVVEHQFSEGSYERDVQHELLGLPTRCRLRRGAIPDQNLPNDFLKEEKQQVDSAIAVLLAVGLVPTAKLSGNVGGLPEDLNKMQIMEDVREGCDANPPSSPGHAEQENGGSPALIKEVKSEEIGIEENGVEELKGGEIEEVKVKEEDFEEVKKSDEEADKVEVEENSNSNHSSSSDSNQNKRKREQDDSPMKKLRSDMEEHFVQRDKIMNDFVELSDCNNLDQIQTYSDQLLSEIRTLNEMAKEKEREWNQLLHLKKLKEELLIRLQRKRQVMTINESDLNEPETNGQQSVLKCNQKMQMLRELRAANLDKLKQKAFMFQTPYKQKTMLDVQSIIADYRQRHPETVPRRGRRIRPSQSSEDLKTGSVLDNAEGLSSLNGTEADLKSYKDILLQFAKMSQSDKELQKNTKPPPPYPEVTVHPVTSTSSVAPTNSLLHGILTKAPVRHNTTPSNTTVNGGKSSFSPTLARLLTAPERGGMGVVTSTPSILGRTLIGPGNAVTLNDIFTGSKMRNEITITPVGGNQLELSSKRGETMEEEPEDPADRLIIDETSDNSNTKSKEDNRSEDGEEVPQCQGCQQKAAQFVCAGCGNQWYCSRDCQVSAWDDHSEVCSG